MATPSPHRSPAAWRRYSGGLMGGGLGLVSVAAVYHFRGMATDTITLVSIAIGTALFIGGIFAARKARPRP